MTHKTKSLIHNIVYTFTAFRTKSDSSISDPQPIRSRAKPHHSASQQRLRVTQRMSLLSRSVRMRMRASIVIPGAAEGVALPDAEPVTIHEAMEVLGEQVHVCVCVCLVWKCL